MQVQTAIESRFLAENTDPRSLIVRVLVAAQRTGQGLTSQEIIGFLEESFGAFRQKQTLPQWSWNKARLVDALSDLQSHKLIEVDKEELYHLTELGRLAGEAGVEVESIIRIVEALSRVNPDSINDPALIAVTQLTVELDKELFPINKRSTQKEPQTWMAEVQRQNVPSGIIRALQRSVGQENQPTLRAKKAVACLLWITDRPLAAIEDILTQFGGRFGGAAGPVRSVRARTCDILPTVARVAEILHPGLDLGERVARLLTRLEVGVPPAAVDLAALAGNRLARGDYHRLLKAGFCDIDVIEQCADEDLLKCLGGAPEKLSIVRDAVRLHAERKQTEAPITPILPPYES